MSIRDLLHKYNNYPAAAGISDLFAADRDRFQAYSIQFEGLMLDYSKTSITDQAMDDLQLTADQAGLSAAIEALFTGAIVNHSENRAVWHTLARKRKGSGEFSQEAGISAEHSRMLKIAKSLRRGKVPGSNADITDIVHLGIGGSELGPRLVSESLNKHAGGMVQLHYLASADGHAITRLLQELKPQNTAFIVASKSFSTRETLLNATLLKEWLRSAGVSDPEFRMLAITAVRETALEFGLESELILNLWPEIGGRYSLWSSIGLSAAIAIGTSAFQDMLAGAQTLDEHFRTAPWRANLPVLLALCAIWHRNVCGYANLAMLPYDFRLRSLPVWLQQLDMESNGKSTDRTGAAIPYATAPTLIGGVGTTAQHSVFQALHQGTDVIPVEFLGVLKPDHDLATHHKFQLGSMLAQGEALMCGRSSADTRNFLEKCGLETVQLELQLPHRTFPGNRPSITLLMDELTPYSLGQLLALYEHKVFVQSIIWNINAFDQWGVEYGKTLAGSYESALESATSPAAESADLLSFVTARIG